MLQNLRKKQLKTLRNKFFLNYYYKKHSESTGCFFYFSEKECYFYSQIKQHVVFQEIVFKKSRRKKSNEKILNSRTGKYRFSI